MSNYLPQSLIEAARRILVRESKRSLISPSALQKLRAGSRPDASDPSFKPLTPQEVAQAAAKMRATGGQARRRKPVANVAEEITRDMSVGDIIKDLEKKYPTKSKEKLTQMASAIWYSKHPEKSRRQMNEDGTFAFRQKQRTERGSPAKAELIGPPKIVRVRRNTPNNRV